MLLEKVGKPFPDDNQDFLVELKADGIRLIVSKWKGNLKFFTRHKNDVTHRFKQYFNDIDLPDGTVLDTEVIVTDQKGRPDFEKIQQVFQSNKSEHQPVLFAFDIIYHQYTKVTNLHILKRKELLETVLPTSNKIVPVQYMIGNGASYFKSIVEYDLEGVVFKDIVKNPSYQVNKRSSSWLKLINYKYETCTIMGIRKEEFGWLLGVEDGNDLRPVGIMEFVPAADRAKVYRLQDKLKVKENEKFIFLDQVVKCKVKFRNYTSNNMLRIPSFVEFVS